MHLLIGQRSDLRLVDLGELGIMAGVAADHIVFHRLIHSRTKHDVDIFDALGGEHLAVLVRRVEAVVKHLNHHRCDVFQKDIAQRGVDMLVDRGAVALECGILLVAGVRFHPEVQPVAQQHLRRLVVLPVRNLGQHLDQLGCDFFLCFPVDGFADGLSRFGIEAERIACFPAPVSALFNGAFSITSSLGWQSYLSFYRFMTGQSYLFSL